jgi:large subunit ribosomal protein L15
MIKFTKINTCSLFFKGFNSNLSNFYKNLSNCHVHTINIIDVGNQAAFEPVTISNIRDNKGSRPLRTRVGRGPGSGKGKTSARGHKGYKAHVGNINRHYEGGQTPITRKLPKHGFRRSRTLREPYAYINLEKIIYLVLKGRLDPTKTITIRDLVWSGGISKSEWGVKVLARGADRLKDIPPLNLEVSSATQIAVDEIKKHGGSVSSVYRNKLTLKYHIKPWKFIRAPLDPLPPFRQTLRLMQLEEKGVK